MKKQLLSLSLIACITVMYACNGQTQPKPISNDLALYQTASLDMKELEIKENSNCVFEDLKGNKWFGSNGNGLTKFDGENYIYYNIEQGLAGNFIRDIEQDRMGNLWICTNKGVNFYNGIFFINFSEKIPLKSRETFCSYKDKNNNIYIGAYAGYYKYNGKDFNYVKLPMLDTSLDEQAYTVRSILEDDLGNLWLGTQAAGLFKYDGKEFKQYKNNGLIKGTNNSIIQDKSGLIWIGNSITGLINYNGESFNNLVINDIVNRNKTEVRENIGVTSLIADENGNVWVGSHNMGLWKLNDKFHRRIETNSTFVNSLFIDSKGKVWVSLMNDGC
jgi:ligand-binding sensor domain-containing protein